MLFTTSGMQGAKVLQRPLGEFRTSPSVGGSMPGQFPMGGRMNNSNVSSHAGFPGAVQGSTNQWHTSPFAQQTFSAPNHPPPPRPQVNRTSSAREDDVNEDGEAPPAYEDAVAAGPDGALPPQRSQTMHNNEARAPGSPSTMMNSMHLGPQPVPNAQAVSSPQAWHSPPWHGQGAIPPQQNMAPNYLPFQVLPPGSAPPGNALAVLPGDPRIGGHLCYKCGGRGVRDTIWLDEETCNRCNGLGRLF